MRHGGNKSKWPFFALPWCVLLSVAAPCFAADQTASASRIGVVNVDLVFREYDRTKSSEAKLEELSNAKQTEREKRVSEIRGMKEELLLLNQESRSERQQAIDEKMKDLAEFDRDTKDKLFKQREDLFKEILDEIEAVVTAYAKDKGFDLILSERAMLYRMDAMDLTDEVLKTLNDRYRQEDRKAEGRKRG